MLPLGAGATLGQARGNKMAPVLLAARLPLVAMRSPFPGPGIIHQLFGYVRPSPPALGFLALFFVSWFVVLRVNEDYFKVDCAPVEVRIDCFHA